MSGSKLLYCIILILLSASFAMGQSYRSEKWLKENNRGNRYEGTYSKEVSSATELVSFMGSFEPYSIGQGQKLSVKFYLPATNAFYLKAEEVRPMNYYWMESSGNAQKGWQSFDNWPVDDWIKKLNVQASNLGVLIKLDGSRSRQVAPAIVFHQHSPTYLDRYVAKYRLGTAITGGNYQIVSGKHERILPVGIKPIHQGVIYRKSGGSFFNILIPTTKLEQEGWYTVAIQLNKYNSNDKINHQFTFYHFPNVN